MHVHAVRRLNSSFPGMDGYKADARAQPEGGAATTSARLAGARTARRAARRGAAHGAVCLRIHSWAAGTSVGAPTSGDRAARAHGVEQHLCHCPGPSPAAPRPRCPAPPSGSAAQPPAPSRLGLGWGEEGGLVACPAPAPRYCSRGATVSPHHPNGCTLRPQSRRRGPLEELAGANSHRPGTRHERRRRANVGPHEVQCTVCTPLGEGQCRGCRGFGKRPKIFSPTGGRRRQPSPRARA